MLTRLQTVHWPGCVWLSPSDGTTQKNGLQWPWAPLRNGRRRFISIHANAGRKFTAKRMHRHTGMDIFFLGDCGGRIDGLTSSSG